MMKDDTAERIVGELARSDPWVRDASESLLCFFCDRYGPGHQADCLWARAQELVKEDQHVVKEVPAAD